jgi:Hpt domain
VTDSRLDFLDEMWAKYSHIARQRVDDLERYVAAAQSGEPGGDLRDAAEWAAHKLGGSLGSFRRAGSAEAAVAERLVRTHAPVADLAPVVRALRALIEAPAADEGRPYGAVTRPTSPPA